MRERLKVGELLIAAGVIDEMQLRAALGDQANWGQRLGVTLVKMGLIEESDLVAALAQQLQIPVVRLEGKRVQQEVLDLLPVDLAEKHMCVPLFVKEHAGVQQLFVGMDDPSDLATVDELTFRTGLEVQPVLVSPSELCEALDRFYHRRSSVSSAPDRAISLEGDPQSTEFSAEASVPLVHESLFPEVAAIEWEETSPSAAATESTQVPDPEAAEQSAEPAEQEAGATSNTPVETVNRAILRALCELLTEKGLIDRAELHARVRAIRAQPDSG